MSNYPECAECVATPIYVLITQGGGLITHDLTVFLDFHKKSIFKKERVSTIIF